MSKEDKDALDPLMEKPKNRLTIDKIMDITLKPVANIDTNIGRIFLYPLTIGAIEKYTDSLEA
jgi:hypothetical protein